MAADDINIAEEAFRKYDEHVIEDDPLDHKIHHSFSELYKVPMSDQIFVAQSNVIRRLASHGPCVIVGRCADMIVDSSLVGVDGCLRAALAYLEDVCKDEEKPEDGEKETV